MNNIENIGKCIAIGLCLLFFLFFKENITFQWIVFAVVLLSIGIPHGAIDHLLPQGSNKKSSLGLFLFKYLGIMALYLISWYFFPKLSLAVFIIISAYHFGQTHFLDFDQIKFKPITYFILGSNFLLIILLSDFQSTYDILISIVDISILEPMSLTLIVILFMTSVGLTLIQRQKGSFKLALEICFLSLLLYFTPLILSFGIYFGFWHALPSMKAEYYALTKQLNSSQLKVFIKQLLPFSSISILGISLILYLSKEFLNEEQVILLFFVLVSLISAPHIFVMNNFIEHQKV
ncbi:Brp/Blh family beta-carotene 15,15'-dioxygenase [Belliella pelovolcani]|uniref:Brp/Blh family beta-carotene 15,15'-dioxygenase n=1 Tax=Belliella pelovolcani TaxID=529505 RepID=UPI003919C011